MTNSNFLIGIPFREKMVPERNAEIASNSPY